jgi:hypothetical protein
VDGSRCQEDRLYRFTIKGKAGTEVGSTPLRGGRSVSQFLIAGDSVIGANFRGASVMFWKYPAGGAPAQTISGLGEPFGVTLSKAPK